MKACYNPGRQVDVSTTSTTGNAAATATSDSSSSVSVSAAAAAAAALHAAAAAASFNPMYSPAAAAAVAGDPFGGLCMLPPHAALALQTGYQQMQKAAALRALHLGAAAAASTTSTVPLDTTGRYLLPVQPYPALGAADAAVAWDQALQYAAAATAARQRAAASAAAAAAAYASVQLPSHMYGTAYLPHVSPPGALAAAAAAAAATAPTAAPPPGPSSGLPRNLTIVPPLHPHHLLQQQNFVGSEPIVISDSDDDSDGRHGVPGFVNHLLQGVPVSGDGRRQQNALGRDKRAVAVCAPFNVKEEPAMSSACSIDLQQVYVNRAPVAADQSLYAHSFGLHRLPQ